MRDIRNDLRERLASIDARYADEMARYDEQRLLLELSHKQAITDLERERAAVQQMLSFEDRREGNQPDTTEQAAAQLVPLVDFLITKLHTHGPLDKDELKAEASAAGYFAEGNGRTLHTTLMNITKNGRIARLSDGRYAFPSPSSGPLFGMDAEPEEGEMRTVM